MNEPMRGGIALWSVMDGDFIDSGISVSETSASEMHYSYIGYPYCNIVVTKGSVGF